MTRSLAHEVAVIGVSCTKFGENFDQSLQEMMVEAVPAPARTPALVSTTCRQHGWVRSRPGSAVARQPSRFRTRLKCAGARLPAWKIIVPPEPMPSAMPLPQSRQGSTKS